MLSIILKVIVVTILIGFTVGIVTKSAFIFYSKLLFYTTKIISSRSMDLQQPNPFQAQGTKKRQVMPLELSHRFRANSDFVKYYKEVRKYNIFCFTVST